MNELESHESPIDMPVWREVVDFDENIGNYSDKNGVMHPTTMGIIHYGKKGAHIIPALPKEASKNYSIHYEDALIFMNRALSGEVSLALRAARITWHKNGIRLFFYYEGEIVEDDYASAECVASELISNYIEHGLAVYIVRYDLPAPIPPEGVVYLREEETSDKLASFIAIQKKLGLPRLK